MPIKKNSDAYQKKFWCLSEKFPVPTKKNSDAYQKIFWYAAEITCILSG